MRKIVLALAASMLLCAQTVLPGFPPGVFSGRAAIDGSAPVGSPMVTPILAASGATSGLTNAATWYSGFTQSAQVSSYSASIRNSPIAIAGAIANLSVRFPAGVGSGTWTVTLEQNGSDSLLACTISSGTTCVDNTHTISVAANDTFSWKVTPASSPTAATVIQIGAVFTSTNNGESFIVSPNSGAAASTSVTNYQGFQGFQPTTTEANASSLVATAGTLDRLSVLTSLAPGLAKTYTVTVNKNGTPTSLLCSVTGASTTTCTDVAGGDGFTVAAGDTISIGIVPTGTPTGAAVTASLRWVPTIPGESLIFVTPSGVPPTTGTTFLNLNGGGTAATESNTFNIAANVFTVKKLNVLISTVPGGSTTRAINFRVGSAAGGTPGSMTCTITSAATTCSDTTNTYATSAGDLLDWQTVATGTNAAMTYFKIGAVAYIP